jgi:hypothetical protein
LEIRKISTREVLETIRRETLLFNLKGKISGKIYCKVDEGRLTLDVDDTPVSCWSSGSPGINGVRAGEKDS